MWYHVSEPNSYLAITGVGIDNVRIAKKCFVMPFQKVTKISITPFDFSMALQAMTSEKLQFARNPSTSPHPISPSHKTNQPTTQSPPSSPSAHTMTRLHWRSTPSS
jgi:hypothetical protein